MGHHQSKYRNLAVGHTRDLGDNIEHLLRCCQHPNQLVNVEGHEQVTALWIAVYIEDIGLASSLIADGADVNIPGGSLDWSPLHIACFHNNIELVKLLLKYGANPNVMDKWNFTPAIYATLCSDPYAVHQIIGLLLQHGCDVNLGAIQGADANNRFNLNIDEPPHNYSGDLMMFNMRPTGATSGTVLHHLAINPHIENETLQLVCEAGCDSTSQNLNGQTPVMCAITDVYYDYHKNVQNHVHFLISNGASLYARDVRGWTAFHYACQKGNINAMQTLMKAGVDCSAVAAMGETPLWVLISHGWSQASKMLIQNGCEMDGSLHTTSIVKMNNDVDVPCYGQITPLEYLICNRFYNLAHLLVVAQCVVCSDLTLKGREGTDDEKLGKIKAAVKYWHNPFHLYSLKEQCRQAVRTAYKQCISLKLDIAGAPPPIKSYVLLEHI